MANVMSRIKFFRPEARLGGCPKASICEGAERTGAGFRDRSKAAHARCAFCGMAGWTHDGLDIPPQDVNGQHANVGEDDCPLKNDADVRHRLGWSREDGRRQRYLGRGGGEGNDRACDGRNHQALTDNGELDLAKPAGDGNRLE